MSVEPRADGLGGELRLGPVFRYFDAEPGGAARFGPASPGATAFAEYGVGARLLLERTDGRAAPRRGFRLLAAAEGFPIVGGGYEPFGDVSATAAAYVPLGLGGTHLALRAGGKALLSHDLDMVPLQHAAFIGGRHTLRGFGWSRFAGHRAAFGGAELRAPLGEVELFVRGELGVFGLLDAARVWVDGASPGGWHTGYGGGAWFAAFDRVISVAVASGDGTRAYVWLGMPF